MKTARGILARRLQPTEAKGQNHTVLCA